MEQDLIVAGVSLGAFIILLVQAIKVTGLLPEEKIGYAPWASALLFLVLYGVEAAVPEAAPYISAVLKAVFGAVSAVLIYFYGVKPSVRALGAKISSEDLEEE